MDVSLTSIQDDCSSICSASLRSVLSKDSIVYDDFGYPIVNLGGGGAATSSSARTLTCRPLHSQHSQRSSSAVPRAPNVDDEPISRSYAATLNNIGALHHERGDAEKAVLCYREALVERMDAPRPTHSLETARRLKETTRKFKHARREERVLRSTRRAANRARAAASPPRALDIYEDGSDLKQRIRSLPDLRPVFIEDDNADLVFHELGCSAVSLYNLAIIYSTEGEAKNHDVALDLFDTALSAIRKCDDGSESTTHLLSLIHNGAGRIFFLKGKIADATEQFRLAARVDRKALEEAEHEQDTGVAAVDHRIISRMKVRLATSESNLGRTYFAVGDFDRAMHYVKDALRLRIDSRGVNHIDVASTLCSIGVVFREMGELEEALDHCRWFVHIAKDAIGVEHPQLRKAIVLTHGIRKEMGLLKHVCRCAAAA